MSRRSVEERLNDAERVLAVLSVMTAALARSDDHSDDLCLSSDVESYAWDYVSCRAQEAFLDLRAIHRTLPAAAQMLACPNVKESE